MSIEQINHPKHYTSHPSGVEIIRLTETCICSPGNAIKYLSRNGLKHADTSIDLEKARWYAENELSRLKEGRLTTDHKALDAFCNMEEDQMKAQAIMLLATAENADDIKEALALIHEMIARAKST